MLPHYIDLWDYVSPPRVLVTLASGTNEFYILYGGSIEPAVVDPIDLDVPTVSGYVVESEQSIDNLFDAAELHVVYNAGGGHTYSSKQQSLLRSSYVSDIYITEETSSYPDSNVIFLATSWGAVAIEEKRGDEDNSSKKIYLVSD
jgi:hypothetical protein